jgi:transposase
MRKITFTEEEIKQLSHESIHHPHPIVRRRMQALLLKSQNVAHYKIARILGLSETTIREYLDLYMKNGLTTLKELHYEGKPNLLLARKEEIIAHFSTEPPTTLREAQAKIEAVTGLRRSLPQISEFLKRANVKLDKSRRNHPDSSFD